MQNDPIFTEAVALVRKSFVTEDLDEKQRLMETALMLNRLAHQLGHPGDEFSERAAHHMSRPSSPRA